MVPAAVLSRNDVVPFLESPVVTGKETILLVEDEAFVREVTVEVLKSAGYAVLVAKNGAEASRFYERFSSEVDLLLTDVVLPDQNGRALARKLRSENARLAVLLVTGYAEQVEMMKLEAACAEYLPKPFSARTLLKRVRTLLDRKPWSAGSDAVTRACGTE